MNSSLFERDHWTLRGPHRARHTRISETRIEIVDCRFFPSGFKAFRIVFQHWVEMQWRWKINNNFERSPFLSFHSAATSTCVSALFGIPVWLRRLTTHTNRQKRLRRCHADALSFPLPPSLSRCLSMCVCLPVRKADSAAAMLDSITPSCERSAISLAPARSHGGHCGGRKSCLGARVSWESWFMGRIVAAHCSV